MTEDTLTAHEPGDDDFRLELDEIARRGAQRMLKDTLEAEVRAFVERHRDQVDESGRRFVVRNGHLPEREVLTGVGPLEVTQPRVRDRRGVPLGLRFL